MLRLKRFTRLSCRLLAWAYLAAGILPFSFCFPVAGDELLGFVAAGVDIWQYDSDEAAPVLELRAARLFTDHERRGFFKIGLLPMLVAENVQIQFRSVSGLTNVLAGLPPWMVGATDSHCVELRSVELFATGSDAIRLKAGLARPKQDGIWELKSVAVFAGAKQTFSLPEAQFQIVGPDAGRLIWKLGGQPQAISLFNTQNPETP